MAAAKTVAADAQDVDTVLPTVTVNSGSDTAPDTRTVPLDTPASTASRLDVPIRDIPSSVEVVNQEVIRERGDRTVTEAAEKTAGMTSGATGGTPGAFSARGFSNNGVAWLYNGVALPGGSGMSARPMDAGNWERIEVLRGPASVLHGAGAIGAAVNLIPREASFAPQKLEVDYSFGSHQAHRLHVGSGGVLKPDVAAWRLDYSGSRQNSAIDGEKTTLQQLTGSVLFKLSPKANLTLEVDHLQDRKRNAYYGTPLVNGQIDESLRHINYNLLQDGRFNARNTWVRANLQWELAPGWKLNNQFYAQKGKSDWRNIERFSWVPGTPATVERKWWGEVGHDRKLIGNRIELQHKGQLAGRENRVLVGLDVNKLDFAVQRNNFGGRDVVNPLQPPVTPFGAQGEPMTPLRDVTLRQAALYAENQWSATDKLKLVGGVRHERIQGQWTYLDQSGHPQARKTHPVTSWRLGSVYEPRPDTSLYASWATGVEPGGTMLLLNRQQSQLPLTTARQFEVGIKQGFWEGRGELTAAAYDIRKKNVFVPDPQRPSERLAVGSQSSRGVELGVAVRPTPQWQLEANTALVRARYNDYTVGNPPVSHSGNRPPFVPRHVSNLGVSYKPNADWRLNAWLRRVGSVYASDANDVQLPAYTTLDLGANYRINAKADLGLRVRNATNALYAHWASGSGQVLLAPPRSYEMAVKLRF